MSTGTGARGAKAAQAGTLLALCAAALALAPLHGDAWWPAAPATSHAWWAGAMLLAYAGATAAVLLRARRAAAARPDAGSVDDCCAPAEDEWLVVHASQTGEAVALAQRTVGALRAAGQRARLCDIATLDAATLACTRRLLAVASTTGEGDAPDPAAGFIRGTMHAGLALPGLRYAVLALGDRSYRHYCAFGHALDGWLRRSGAQPLFDLVEVDNGDPAALRHWQHQLGTVAGASDAPDWTPVPCQPWTLATRRELNPGSAGAAVFELRLTPPAGTDAQWRAGDIAEVLPRQDPAEVDAMLRAAGQDPAAHVRGPAGPMTLAELASRSQLVPADGIRGLPAQAVAERLQPLPSREYSIASIPAEGSLRLLLRRMQRPDGRPGIGSGWLCDHARPGGTVDLRIRANPGFHAPASDRPLVLVGNGTGIAGLRAHLAERIAAGGGRSWLLFGERHASRDFHQREDLLRWLDDDGLERLDLAWSRDADDAALPAAAVRDGRIAVHRGYVQDALRSESGRLRAWIDAGATVLVCGSLQGMAPGVDAALRDILGGSTVDDLRASGRYRRDVY